MKYLLLFALLYVAYAVWRNNRLEDQGSRRPPPERRPGTPQEMVACGFCGVHLPKSDAVQGARGAWYCSEDHRLRAGG